MMRRFLDGLYLASGGLAAAFLAASCLIVMLQVGANLLSDLTEWMWGTPITLGIPSYAHLAGYAFASASFLGLGYTFRTDGHIRVGFLIQSVSARGRVWLEAWCLGAACLVSLFFTWSAICYVADSLYFGDITAGMVAIPLWIPQSSMAVGSIVLSIAIIDRAVEFAANVRSATGGSGADKRKLSAIPGMIHPQPNRIWDVGTLTRNELEKMHGA